MTQHDDLLYVRHIIQACERIERYIAGVSLPEFQENDEKQSAVIRQLEVIGEAAGRVSSAFRDKFPDIPSRQLKDLRNVLIHGYADVDLQRVWALARERVKPLREAILRAATGLPE
jgi:uncharacterized protein with HEPN domain